MTKWNDDYFGNSTKCWIYDNVYVDNKVKVREHCHISVSALRDFNINVKLNDKIPAVFYNLEKLWFTSYYARTRLNQNTFYTK